ncbi:hypothetical protein EGW08_023726 [Elysia chlorotica]|uniref:DUF7869 domain-containing protein n=1 Tax=Elysia chlorotica TaxID=188477 RepID=A0A3S1AVN1_ELYCH|nr:hypothetical protein EGW08_023726 [Elysia chlorotica]
MSCDDLNQEFYNQENSDSSDSDDDFPLQAIRGIRDLVEYKRQKAASLKANKKESLSTDAFPPMNQGTSTELPTSPRKASQKARENLHEIFLDDSGHLDIDLDDSDADPDFMPEAKRKRNIEDDDDDEEEFLLPGIVADRVDLFEQQNDRPQEEESSDEPRIVQQKKKRKTLDERNMERAEKQRKKIAQYMVKPGCINSCKRVKKCGDSYSEEDRLNVNKYFWSLDYSGRKSFIIERVNKCEVKRRRISQEENKKNASMKYTLKGKDGTVLEVCKSFFLGTLGLAPNNDTIVRKTFAKYESENSACTDGRGKNQKKTTNINSMRDHIESYRPVVSHYSREKTPLRRYLPCDVTVTDMHKEYNSKYAPVSFSTFYRVFKTMKISMSSLGNEECEVCEKHKQHSQNCDCEEVCNISDYLLHKKKYRAARAAYKKDAEENHKCAGDLKISADLQKVLVLPKIDQFKSCVFASRLIVFNETMSELGKGGRDTAVLWHEAIAGRKDEDISSAFHMFIKHLRDIKTLTMWLDNCSGQNKNWTFFTMLLYLVNNPKYEVEKIQLKYFEPGHSFMASDAAHGRIEKQMRNMGKLYDFRDFVEATKGAKCEPLQMVFSDFSNWTAGVSQYALKQLGDRRPYLKNMVSVAFSKGSEEIVYQTAFDQPEIRAKVLKSNFDLATSSGGIRKRPRGIETSKKKDLLEKMLPLMPENRRSFWINLPEDKKSTDLSIHY